MPCQCADSRPITLPAEEPKPVSDHLISADRLSGLGVARVVQVPEVTNQSTSTGVQALLIDPAYRQRATAIREDIAAMSSPAEVARMLVERVSEWSAALVPGKGR
jgi:UDP:flavonoid glycosyltransferase YjiC (YdhE family)